MLKSKFRMKGYLRASRRSDRSIEPRINATSLHKLNYSPTSYSSVCILHAQKLRSVFNLQSKRPATEPQWSPMVIFSFPSPSTPQKTDHLSYPLPSSSFSWRLVHLTLHSLLLPLAFFSFPLSLQPWQRGRQNRWHFVVRVVRPAIVVMEYLKGWEGNVDNEDMDIYSLSFVIGWTYSGLNTTPPKN